MKTGKPSEPVATSWVPQYGPQKAFVESDVFEVVYGGARGGGKTDAALGEFALHAETYGSGARGLLVRRTRVALEPTIARARQIFVGAQWTEQKSRFTWPNGAQLSFRHLDNDSHADAYQGHDYSRVYIEELTQFGSPRLVDKLALIPALIVGAAGVAGAAISANAASHASDAASATAARDDALQQQTYDSNRSLIQPEIDRGAAAADELQGFLGLGDDPARAQAALQTYLGSTGYQFDLNQGLNAVEQSKSAEGLYNSGAAEKALDAYGSGLAQTYGQSYASDLAGVAQTGAGAINVLTGAAVNNANQQQSNNVSAAATTASAGLASASAINALIAKGVNAYTMTRGESSYADTSNAFAPGG